MCSGIEILVVAIVLLMKMMSRHSITSTSGVTLIADIGASSACPTSLLMMLWCAMQEPEES